MARVTEFPRSLAGLSGALRAGEVSPVEVTEGMLDRIGADRTNAFITVTAERAMEDARRAEAEMSAGRDGGPAPGGAPPGPGRPGPPRLSRWRRSGRWRTPEGRRRRSRPAGTAARCTGCPSQ